MNEIDGFSSRLLEQAKRFLEKARETKDESSRDASLNSALLLAFCSFEAHFNSVAEELSLREGLTVLDESILKEAEFRLDAGEFKSTNGLKMYRLEDRIEFVFCRFTKTKLPKSEPWWGELKEGMRLRNQLVHPKSGLQIDIKEVERSLSAVLSCLDALYRAVFKKGFPAMKRGLSSKETF